MNLAAALTDALSGDAARVSLRREDRLVYARDMWPRGLLSVAAGVAPESVPDAVVFPASTAEVAAVVRACRALRVPLIPFGAGSGVCGGAASTPEAQKDRSRERQGVVLDTKRMRRLLHVDEEALCATFQPGILGAHLEEALARRGLTLGHFPSSIMCSTAGGWIATRGAGQCSTRYGKIEDMVRAVTLVTGTGDVLTLQGGDAGPDLLQLIVGSEGTLGILTEATCALRRAPASRRMRGWGFPSIPEALRGIRLVLQAGLRPAVVRLYDELDTLISSAGKRHGTEGPGSPGGLDGPGALALQHAGARTGLTAADLSLDDWLQMLRPDVQRAGAGLSKWLMSRALSRPGVLNRLADRLGPRLSGGCQLILGCEGEADLTFAEERAAAEILTAAGGRDLGPGPGDRWLRHRYDVSFKMPRMFAAGAFVDTMEVATTWDRLLDLYEGVRAAVRPLAFIMAHFSHAYPDGCSIYFTFAARREGDGAALRIDEARYDAIWDAALSAAVRCGGTISHHHGIGKLKAAYMKDEHGAGMDLYQALKQTLDPDGILNPGKMGLLPYGPPKEGGARP
jgi:alkyldihydroxyacetonephosphate synthase